MSTARHGIGIGRDETAVGHAGIARCVCPGRGRAVDRVVRRVEREGYRPTAIDLCHQDRGDPEPNEDRSRLTHSEHATMASMRPGPR